MLLGNLITQGHDSLTIASRRFRRSVRSAGGGRVAEENAPFVYMNVAERRDSSDMSSSNDMAEDQRRG